MKRLVGILILLSSLNSLGGIPTEVKFSNGARLVIGFVFGAPRNLLYYPPRGSSAIQIAGGQTRLIKLVKNLNQTPEDMVNSHFNGKAGGVTPNFWPVIIEDPANDKLLRLYVSENGEILEVALQLNGGPKGVAYDHLAFDFPDRWEIHRLIFGEKEYLVLVEERGGQPTAFRYLRLEDGFMATYLDRSESSKVFFDESTGLLNEEKAGNIVTYSPKDLLFNPVDRGADHHENWWFPEIEQARALDLSPLGPFTNSKKVEGQVSEPKKEISISEKGKLDISAMRSEKAAFKAAAVEFAASLKPRPPYNVVGEFHYARYVLGQTAKKTLVVVDTWTNEITDTITLEDEIFSVENTPKGYTTTIAYPQLRSEIVYKQPDSENSNLRKISRREESIPEFCKDIFQRGLKVRETAPAK